MKPFIRVLILSILALSLSTNTATSQSEGGRMAFGINGGAVKYWGEFTDNQLWFGGDAFLRYNIFAQLSIQATFGISNIRYKTDASAIGSYPDYFGQGAEKGDMYPNTNIGIQDKNSVRVNTYEMYLSYNFFTYEKFVPYLFGGVGLMNFEPRSGDTGFAGPLPNNLNNVYDKNQVVFPVGFGYEMYLTDDLVFNGRATFRFTGTDYLDDVSPVEDAQAGDANDAFMTFGLGFSYYILGDADYDKDGLTNSKEKELGTDPNIPDTDGDGLLDGEEYLTHHSDPLKQDTDDDGLDDFKEVMETKTDPTKADGDSDGLTDGQELARKTNPMEADSDGDGLLDGEEVNKYETNPLTADTDGDGLTDGEEVQTYGSSPKVKDTDKDGLDDGDEVNKYKTNPAQADSDQDGLNDGLEVTTHKTDPTKPDTDGDSLLDGDEVNKHSSDPTKMDTDSDGLTDGDEVKKHKTNPVSDDSDKDGLKDGDEVNKHKTDPTNKDSDSDGLTDGDEVLKHKTNPLEKDTDGDGLTDGDEINKYQTNPNNPDTDGESLSDGVEVNKTNTDPNNPDTDGDSVNDAEDDCPLVKGKPSTEEGENGCPQAPKIGTKVDFPDILFIVDTDKFNYDYPGTSRNLAKLLSYVQQCDGLEILIGGHASAEGADDYNQKLSEKRAKKVKEWLLEQGVNPAKISGFLGYGEREPKVAEPTGAALKKMPADELEAIRKQNRRISVEVTKTCQEGAKK
jgi:outer membrane protein OmpA-like peptidoglycan-associated protein